jgi:DNA-binding MurR/RpiR family transcriptional regulator
MSLKEAIASSAEALTSSERRLVQEILAKPRAVALGTAADLARSAGVHEATASRLARKLGFEKYATFRDAIRDEFIVRTDPAVRVLNTLAQTGSTGVLEDLISREISALTSLANYVTSAKLRQAAQILAKPRKIFIFARGNAEALAVMMERRLRRFGLDVQRLQGDGRDLAEQVLDLRHDDVLLAFAFRRQPRHYAPLIERARIVGAPSVVIAGSIGPTLVPAPGHLLYAPRSGSTEQFQTLTVPMAICNALILAMAQNNRTRSLRRLENLGELIEEFENS